MPKPAITRSRMSSGAGNTETRRAILDAAERLFAEEGVQAVSNRQIAAAAGRGDTSVVGYYFESKADLVRELLRRYNTRVDLLRDKMLDQVGESESLRDWIECLVYPYTDIFDADGVPGWHARLGVQIVADPTLRDIAVQETNTATFRRLLRGLDRCLPELSPELKRERTRIASHVIVHSCADLERAMANGLPLPFPSWSESAAVIIDAIVGLLTAPVSEPGRRGG
ncbi:TetR/AcrR family transcriptional regulator [Fodinicola acaciae]|uniref:TetR/AcrR family transcriptional regulator n=1 Tax=Fodinicola acaciae TaxID=2681555 RepID=UPI001C9E34E0|nr:TetR family transcriptional regulator [Fodinicola acaciae]